MAAGENRKFLNCSHTKKGFRTPPHKKDSQPTGTAIPYILVFYDQNLNGQMCLVLKNIFNSKNQGSVSVTVFAVADIVSHILIFCSYKLFLSLCDRC